METTSRLSHQGEKAHGWRPEDSVGPPHWLPAPGPGPVPPSPQSPPRPRAHQLEVKHAVLGFLQERHELGGEKSQTLLVPAWSTRGRRRLWPGLRHRTRPPAASPQPGQARPAAAPLPLPFLVARPPELSRRLPLPSRAFPGYLVQLPSADPDAKLRGTVGKCIISKGNENNSLGLLENLKKLYDRKWKRLVSSTGS